MKLNMGRPSYSYTGKIAWALVWVALGAMAGTLFWKVREPKPGPAGPVTIPATGDTAANPDLTDDATASTGATAAGATAGPAGGDTAPVSVDTVPTISTPEVDRQLVKQAIFDYYEMISQNKNQQAKDLWKDPDAKTLKNIDIAISTFDQIVIIPETFEITTITEADAVARFTIKAYLKTGNYNSYYKEAQLTKMGQDWKIVNTQNPK